MPPPRRVSSDLCQNLACPLTTGQPTLLHVRQKLPVLAPPGPYDLKLQGQDSAGLPFLCVKLHFNMAAAAAAAQGGAAASGTRAAGAAAPAGAGQEAATRVARPDLAGSGWQQQQEQ